MALVLFVFIFATALNAQDEKIIRPHEFGIGIGIGNAFGAIGFNAEYNIANYLGVFAGIGMANNIPTNIQTYRPIPNNFKLNFPVGVRFYPLPYSSIFRPRLNISYGINGYLAYFMENSRGEIIGSYKALSYGISAGAGIKCMIGEDKNFSLEGDANWALTQKPWIDLIPFTHQTRKEDNSYLTISLGFRYEFDVFR